jgi:ribonucleoside-diphosphate reductase alpha chain
MFKITRGSEATLLPFATSMLADRYLLKNETPQDMFERVSCAYADNQEHAQRLYGYISKLWFMPATPVLANGGTERGLPISCFLNEVPDSMAGIAGTFHENTFLASGGGGIGTCWSNVRSINESIKDRGTSSGIIPFLKTQDSYTLAISQGSLRRGSSAAYLDISHPEIEEFIDIRRPTGGDPNRRSLNVHHGVCVSDAFMQAVQDGATWELKSPKDGKVIEAVKARDLWIKILNARIETGEPYILYTGNVDKNRSKVYEANGLKCKTSNLCSEIMLTTGLDYNAKERTAVCCLSSLNLEYYNTWKDNALFIEDIYRFLDNVLEDFIKRAPDSLQNAKYSAMMERSVGLGVMGFHSFLQSKNTPIEGVAAKSWNRQIFRHIRYEADEASKKLADEKGSCPDAERAGIKARFSNLLAVAPTASISIIAGNTSPGIEPLAANCFTQKTLSGSFTVKNQYLEKLLTEKGKNGDKVWSSIATNEGSVQHLDFLTPEEKDVFKTAIEINQKWLIEHAADRQEFIDQGQSLNIFVKGNVTKKDLHDLHFTAWKKGVKSLYYCRSVSLQHAEKAPSSIQEKPIEAPVKKPEYDECLACQ